MGKLVVEDKNHIKDIIFKYPDIMSENAKDIIKSVLIKESAIRDRLWELRQELYSLENDLRDLNLFKSSIQNLYSIEYGSKEIEEIKGECNILINNKEDYRNK